MNDKISKIERKLMEVDKMIDKWHEEAARNNNFGNKERAIYLEGEADGMSRIHRYITAILEGDD